MHDERKQPTTAEAARLRAMLMDMHRDSQSTDRDAEADGPPPRPLSSGVTADGPGGTGAAALAAATRQLADENSQLAQYLRRCADECRHVTAENASLRAELGGSRAACRQLEEACARLQGYAEEQRRLRAAAQAQAKAPPPLLLLDLPVPPPCYGNAQQWRVVARRLARCVRYADGLTASVAGGTLHERDRAPSIEEAEGDAVSGGCAPGQLVALLDSLDGSLARLEAEVSTQARARLKPRAAPLARIVLPPWASPGPSAAHGGPEDSFVRLRSIQERLLTDGEGPTPSEPGGRRAAPRQAHLLSCVAELESLLLADNNKYSDDDDDSPSEPEAALLPSADSNGATLNGTPSSFPEAAWQQRLLVTVNEGLRRENEELRSRLGL